MVGIYVRTVLGFLRHVAREAGVVDGRGDTMPGGRARSVRGPCLRTPFCEPREPRPR